MKYKTYQKEKKILKFPFQGKYRKFRQNTFVILTVNKIFDFTGKFKAAEI